MKINMEINIKKVMRIQTNFMVDQDREKIVNLQNVQDQNREMRVNNQ